MPRTLPQYQQDALLVLRTRLDPECPENQATEEIKTHLRALRVYLDAWVMPALDAMEGISGSGYDPWLRRDMHRQAITMRSRAAARRSA